MVIFWVRSESNSSKCLGLKASFFKAQKLLSLKHTLPPSLYLGKSLLVSSSISQSCQLAELLSAIDYFQPHQNPKPVESKNLRRFKPLPMASINFNSFESWFRKPQNPIQPIDLLSLAESFLPKTVSNPPKSKFRFHKSLQPLQEKTQDFRASSVVQFLARREEVAVEINRMELKENEEPFRKEDKKLWQALPHVIGLDERPMPRKGIKTREESDDKFWDFTKQFFFGLWGFPRDLIGRVDPLMLLRLLGISGSRSVTVTVSLVFLMDCWSLF